MSAQVDAQYVMQSQWSLKYQPDGPLSQEQHGIQALDNQLHQRDVQWVEAPNADSHQDCCQTSAVPAATATNKFHYELYLALYMHTN